MYYSQIRQDERVIKELYPDSVGFFVEIGAFDGVTISNTKALENIGWEGICVEANPIQYTQLIKNRSCKTVQSAVYHTSNIVLDFIINKEQPLLSSLAETIQSDLIGTERITVKTKTITDILDECNSPGKIHYLSLDVHGGEFNVLKGLDFDKYQFGVINLAHNFRSDRRQIRQLLNSKGYKLYIEDSFDDWFIHNSTAKYLTVYSPRQVTFYRNELCGLCSHLTCLVAALSAIKPNQFGLQINLANYSCQWSDLFVYQEVSLKKRTYLVDAAVSAGCKFHQSYFSNSDLDIWHNTWKTYIRVKPELMDKVNELLVKYPIKESTCVYFRGLDKFMEAPRVAYEEYLKHIPEFGPIYVQSDELDFIQYVKLKYPERAFSIDGFKHLNCQKTNFANSIHGQATINDAIEIIIIFHLIASSKKIISGISNVTWMALIVRGNNEGYIAVQ